VYGGEAEKGRSLDDFHVLSLKNWQWKKLFLMQFPPPRHMHTMTDMSSHRLIQKIYNAVELYLEVCHFHLTNYSMMYGYSKTYLLYKTPHKFKNYMVVPAIFNIPKVMFLQLARVIRRRFMGRICMFLEDKPKTRIHILRYIVCLWVSIPTLHRYIRLETYRT
jgi:hypothetical protein